MTAAIPQWRESGWRDVMGVSELKKFLSLVNAIPASRTEQALQHDLLNEILQAKSNVDSPDVKTSTLRQSSVESALMPAKVRAILWDNDGVLVDSESSFFDLTRRVFRDHHLVLEREFWAEHFLGHGLHTYEIAGLLGMDRDSALRLAAHRDILWRQRLRSPIPVKEGVREVLESLDRRYQMAVVTGAPRDHFEDIHRFSGLLKFFETTITAAECPQVKPKPDAYIMAMRQFGLQPDQCIAIEDSPRGLKAAVSAGIRCVLLATPYTDMSLCKDATWVVEDIRDLSRILAGQ